jgi:hypothetical protein
MHRTNLVSLLQLSRRRYIRLVERGYLREAAIPAKEEQDGSAFMVPLDAHHGAQHAQPLAFVTGISRDSLSS